MDDLEKDLSYILMCLSSICHRCWLNSKFILGVPYCSCEQLNFTKKVQEGYIKNKDIYGEEELRSSKVYPIQEEVSLLWRPLTIPLILTTLTKDNLSL